MGSTIKKVSGSGIIPSLLPFHPGMRTLLGWLGLLIQPLWGWDEGRWWTVPSRLHAVRRVVPKGDPCSTQESGLQSQEAETTDTPCGDLSKLSDVLWHCWVSSLFQADFLQTLFSIVSLNFLFPLAESWVIFPRGLVILVHKQFRGVGRRVQQQSLLLLKYCFQKLVSAKSLGHVSCLVSWLTYSPGSLTDQVSDCGFSLPWNQVVFEPWPGKQRSLAVLQHQMQHLFLEFGIF